MGGKIVVDSNVLVALMKIDDSTHDDAERLARELHKRGYVFLALNLVVQETATVISMKVGQGEAVRFYNTRNGVIDEEVELDRNLEDLAWQIFQKQKKKGTSFVDCANLAVIEKYKLDGILTFDEFYPKEIRAS